MKKLTAISLFSSLFVLHGCTPDLEVPNPTPGEIDFTRTIAIGGDYMAGYQDGALYKKGQEVCLPVLLSEKFQLVGAYGFNQVLMPDNNGLGLNSKPWEGWFVTPSHLDYKTDCKGVTSLSPVKSDLALSAATPYLSGLAGNSVQNISVPFATMADYFNPAFGSPFAPPANTNPYYSRIAGTPGTSTMYSDAMDQDPTFFSAWVGMEDIYNFAARGGTGAPIPSSAQFSMYLDSLLRGMTAHGAKGVIANIPDFKCFPYYTLVAWDNADLTQGQADTLNDLYTPAGLDHIFFEAGRNGFVIDDVDAPGGVRQMHSGEYITLSVPLDSMKCQKYGLLVNTINDRYAIDSTEVVEIEQAIRDYNNVIAQKAAQYNLALVDMYSYFNTVKTGIKWDGADFNAEFVSGGFFSLDGYHPNQKGYALIANEFIKAINMKYSALIPTVNCETCNGVLFP